MTGLSQREVFYAATVTGGLAVCVLVVFQFASTQLYIDSVARYLSFVTGAFIAHAIHVKGQLQGLGDNEASARELERLNLVIEEYRGRLFGLIVFYVALSFFNVMLPWLVDVVSARHVLAIVNLTLNLSAMVSAVFVHHQSNEIDGFKDRLRERKQRRAERHAAIQKMRQGRQGQ